MDVRSVRVTGPLGDVPPSEQWMTVTRADRADGPVDGLRGEVDLSTGGRLRDTVSSVLQQAGAGPVILDRSAVEFLTSSGLGHLVALDEDIPEVPDGPAARDAITHLRRELDRPLQMGYGCVELARFCRKPTRFPPKGKLVGRIRRDLQG